MPRKQTPPASQAPREPAFAILYLQDALDRVHTHLLAATDADELMRLSRALSVCTTALFNAHRIAHLLSAGSGVLDEALKALGELEFDEDSENLYTDEHGLHGASRICLLVSQEVRVHPRFRFAWQIVANRS